MKYLLFISLLSFSTPIFASVPLSEKSFACSRLSTSGIYGEKWFKKKYDIEQRTQILTHCHVKQIEKMKRDANKKI